MPFQPVPTCRNIQDELCWTINWRDVFAAGLKFWSPRPSGEMRGFHVVFRLRMRSTGTLVFWDDDGCLIRRRSRLIHEDRSSHALSRSEIQVYAGDRLEIAQWQYKEEWIWAGRLAAAGGEPFQDGDSLLRYLGAVTHRLRHADGPPLKMYFAGDSPIRTVLSLYSIVLNGYTPSDVFIFGDYQWPPISRRIFETLLPFAHFARTAQVLERIEGCGGLQLVDLALRHWFVMKICVALLYPPYEFCFVDDDVLILRRMEEALAAFQSYNLVFAPDADYSADYLAIWESNGASKKVLPTGTINTGLYCLRHVREPCRLAAKIMRNPPKGTPGWQWEQGFMACHFADESVCVLPGSRYFYPYFDGLPGGLLNYDYALNPCDFVSIHFGGLAEKLSDTAAIMLAPEILGEHTP